MYLKPCIECGKECEILPLQLSDFATLCLLRNWRELKMSRCQYCHKLTHSEHLIVEYSPENQDKVYELTFLKEWTPKYQYATSESDPAEYGKLKCGDIYIHFKLKLDGQNGKSG